MIARTNVAPRVVASAVIRRSRVGYLVGIVVLMTWPTGPLHAQFRVVDVNDTARKKQIALPFAFYTSDVNLAVGAGWGSFGAPQEQMSVLVAGYGSTNGSWGVPLVVQGAQLPFNERLFFDMMTFMGRYRESQSYWDGSPDFPLERAGSNDSDEENYLEGVMNQYIVRPTFKYVLPIGAAREEAIHTYVVKEGMLTENPMGGGPWNPFTGGRSRLELEPFYRSESVETDTGRESRRTNGVKFSLAYDNSNFHLNPSRGSRQSLSVARDWELWDSSGSWTNLEAEYSKFVRLPTPQGCRQHVLALNFWTAYTPTWRQRGTDENGQPIYHRPPEFMGASLGGFWHMRAFSSNRFSDKAAIYYAAESRLMPEWNPIKSISWLDWLKVEWLQAVVFAEVGRVAPSWNLDELHQDMKWDVGVGLRFWDAGFVGRADVAFAEQSTGIRIMMGHTF